MDSVIMPPHYTNSWCLVTIGVHFISWYASDLPGKRPQLRWDDKEKEVVLIIDGAPGVIRTYL